MNFRIVCFCRYLVKKLEQYEEVDYPRCLPSSRAAVTGLTLPTPHSLHTPTPHSLHTPTPHPLLLTAAANRVRAEVEAALSQETDQSNDSNGQPSELNSPKHRPEKLIVSHSNPMTVMPQSTVIQGPLSLIPIPSPVSVPDRTIFGPPKTKRSKKNPLKSAGRMSAATKRRKGDIDPNAPKKPSNAFFWFCQARRAELQEQFKGEVTTGQHDLTKALARLWGETPPDDKKVGVVNSKQLCVLRSISYACSYSTISIRWIKLAMIKKWCTTSRANRL